MLSIKLSPPSAHAVAARAARERERVPNPYELNKKIEREIAQNGDLEIFKITRMQPMLQRTRLSFHEQVVSEYEHVPSSDELIKEIEQKIAEKGHSRTINAATPTELNEMLEHGNKLAKLWKQWEDDVKGDKLTSDQIKKLNEGYQALMNGIQFHETKIAVLLSEICVNRLTCNEATPGEWTPRSKFVKNWLKSRIKNTNKNPLPPTKPPVEFDQYQTEKTTLTTTLQNGLRCRQSKEQTGLKETTFQHPQQKINKQTYPNIGTTIKQEKPDSEDLIISGSPVNDCRSVYYSDKHHRGHIKKNR